VERRPGLQGVAKHSNKAASCFRFLRSRLTTKAVTNLIFSSRYLRVDEGDPIPDDGDSVLGNNGLRVELHALDLGVLPVPHLLFRIEGFRIWGLGLGVLRVKG